MSIYNYLLLAVPVVGIFGILLALRFRDDVSNQKHLRPGE